MSSQSPRRETAGGFSFHSSSSAEQNVLAQKQQLLVRYYLWTADGPWRLPSQLHRDLLDRVVALPQFAGTKQKMLVVFARRIGVNTYSLRGQGSICGFWMDEQLVIFILFRTDDCQHVQGIKIFWCVCKYFSTDDFCLC